MVVTKADTCDREDLQKTVHELKEMIIANRGVPFEVEREQHVAKAAERFARNEYVDNKTKQVSVCSSATFPRCRAVPILTVSSVTGYNLHLVKKFLNALPPKLSKKDVEEREQDPHEFQVCTRRGKGLSYSS